MDDISKTIEFLKNRSAEKPGARRMYENAIRILEQVKAGELVSKQDVIDELNDWTGEKAMTQAEDWHLRQVIGSIKSL